jgi:hypothetical protein
MQRRIEMDALAASQHGSVPSDLDRQFSSEHINEFLAVMMIGNAFMLRIGGNGNEVGAQMLVGTWPRQLLVRVGAGPDLLAFDPGGGFLLSVALNALAPISSVRLNCSTSPRAAWSRPFPPAPEDRGYPVSCARSRRLIFRLSRYDRIRRPNDVFSSFFAFAMLTFPT